MARLRAEEADRRVLSLLSDRAARWRLTQLTSAQAEARRAGKLLVNAREWEVVARLAPFRNYLGDPVATIQGLRIVREPNPGEKP